jgi:cytosine/adenosine deaminase-related metal-dependent hydrolase
LNLKHPSRLVSAGAQFVLAVTFVFSSGRPGIAQGQQQSAEIPKRASIAIEEAAVVDVARGEIVSPRTVLIVNGKIVAMGEPDAITIPSEAVRVEGRGRYLMPGLVDMHVHLFNDASRRPPNDWAFPLFVANGVTGIREMRTEPASLETVQRWRAKAARAEIVAPRVLAAGVAVSGETADTARQQVREAKTAGADFLKIFSSVRERQWRAIIEEARVLRMPVGGHVPAEISLLEAATAGQRNNEHLTQVYEACSDKETQWLDARKGLENKELGKLREAQEQPVLESFDQSACDRIAAALARTEQAQVPTLVLSSFEARGSPRNPRDDPHWNYLRADEQARWERIFKEGYPVAGDKLAARRWEVSRQIVKTLHAAGVRILAGSDAPMPQVYPGFSLHNELELLVESGLSPADALRAATIGPAEFLGLSESAGSIAVGKRADLLLLDGNPLADITQTQRIRAVVLDGRLLQRADLDRLLESARHTPAK